MKAKRSNSAGVIAMLLIGAAGVYAVGFYIKKTPEAQNVPPPLHRTQSDKGNVGQPADQKSSVKIITPESHSGDLKLNQTDESVPTGTDPILFAVNRFFENSHITTPDAKVLNVDVKEGVALINCTEAMDKGHGSSDEQALIQGLSKTLSQFANVKKFQVLVSGKPVSWGNIDMSEPLDVTPPDDSSTKTGA